MMRMTTPRPRRHARSLTVRAIFIAAVFSLTALYQYYNSASASSSSSSDLDSSWFRGEQKKLEEIEAKEDLDPDTEEYADNRPVVQAQDHLQIQDGGGPGAAVRKLLLVVPPAAIRPYNDTGDNSTGEPPHVADSNHTSICTPPAYHEFPTDAFTPEQRKNGAIVLHFIMVIYMFTALAVVCDIYFVASLEKICYKLDLSADVAGATFMAAGSSAPELFTSIIGVFIAKGDVGVGTIVGSAVFNILFVVGICGVLVSEAVPLTWYPLMRDSLFYVLSVIMLIASIADTQVTWYEATLMLILYVFYILVMKFNPIIQAWITPRVHLFTHAVAEDASKIITGAEKGKFYGGNTYDGTTVTEMFTNEQPAEHTGGYQSGAPPSSNGPRPMGPGGHGTTKVIPVDDYVLKSTRKVSFEDACFRFMKMRGFRPKTRFRSAVLIIMCERRKLLRDPVFMRREQQAMYVYGSVPDSYSNANKQNIDLVEDPEPMNQWRRMPSSEEGYIARVKWAFLLPINVLLYYTVPECNLPRWDSWFMVTFGMSIVWIAAFSYVMVWMVVLIGFTLGIPDSIMGITFLAAGTSVPDAMASVMVARQGHGDMAVANTIGSNVFDVLVGLALPWFLMTACVNPGSAVHINSNGMVFSVILLFLTVIITIVAIQIGGWKLDKKLGVICLSCYAVFLTFSIMIEFNVFGYVNPPMCLE